MVRTRDFLLVLVIVAFLLIAIVFSFIKNTAGPVADNSVDTTIFKEADDLVIQAEVAKEKIAKEDVLAQWREKLKDYVPKKTEEVIVADAGSEMLDMDISSSSVLNTVVRCPSFSLNTKIYPRLYLHEVEGVRLVTNSALEGDASAVVLAVLPIKTVSAGVPTCLASDVIGVATNGLPIKLNDSALYSVFGEETLIGYALDGFPIYGQTKTKNLDRCGGVLTAEGYRYYLSTERETVIQCYSGQPVTI